MIELKSLALFTIVTLLLAFAGQAQVAITRYVRYSHEGQTSYGILEEDTVRELSGSLFESPKATGKRLKRSEVRLLAPCEPSKIVAVGLNYKSHLGQRPQAAYPGLFAKYPTCVIGPEESIVFPEGAQNVHPEGELVVVIGKRAKNVSVEDAPKYVFGITCGNDVSERDWQKSDLQWFRAKASDTFGPLGPAIVQGLNYNDLLLQTRVNGEIRQSQRTRDLIFSVDEIVSYVSRYVTLLPGDLIFTGTPGTTQAIKAGDVVEVELEGVGVLRNKVAPATARD